MYCYAVVRINKVIFYYSVQRLQIVASGYKGGEGGKHPVLSGAYTVLSRRLVLFDARSFNKESKDFLFFQTIHKNFHYIEVYSVLRERTAPFRIFFVSKGSPCRFH